MGAEPRFYRVGESEDLLHDGEDVLNTTDLHT